MLLEQVQHLLVAHLDSQITRISAVVVLQHHLEGPYRPVVLELEELIHELVVVLDDQQVESGHLVELDMASREVRIDGGRLVCPAVRRPIGAERARKGEEEGL